MEIITPGESGAEISVSEISVNSAKKDRYGQDSFRTHSLPPA